MAALTCPRDWRDEKVQEWLLLLLRFAITREPSDQASALAMADELDSINVRWRPAAPNFFLRTSNDVCEALLGTKIGNENAVLHRHASRIADLRLKQAFEVAAGLHADTRPRQQDAKSKKRKVRNLWEGLPKSGDLDSR